MTTPQQQPTHLPPLKDQERGAHYNSAKCVIRAFCWGYTRDGSKLLHLSWPRERHGAKFTSKASRRICSRTCSGPAQPAHAAASPSLQTHPRFPSASREMTDTLRGIGPRGTTNNASPIGWAIPVTLQSYELGPVTSTSADSKDTRSPLV